MRKMTKAEQQLIDRIVRQLSAGLYQHIGRSADYMFKTWLFGDDAARDQHILKHLGRDDEWEVEVRINGGSLHLFDDKQKLAAARLTARGLLADRYGDWIDAGDLTPAFWQYIGLTPAKLAHHFVSYDLEWSHYYAQRSSQEDHACWPSQWRIDSIREAYRNPDLTAGEVYRIERERTLDCYTSYEAEMQAHEWKLARLEIMIAKGL